MKTHYRVLWIDDDMPSVHDDQESMKEFLKEVGIETILYPVESDGSSQIHEKILAFLSDPDLDLIVVDFMMGSFDGKELIKLIRESDHVYLPVIFYSAAGVQRLADAAADGMLDGVYLSHRDGVRHKIANVITSLLRKEQSIQRVRGLLMEGVSELDATLGSIFDTLWERLDEAMQKQLVAYFRSIIKERAEKADEAAKDFPEDIAGFLDSIKGSFVSAKFDTAIRWRVVKKILKMLEFPKELQVRFHEFFEPPESIVRLRNNYAHKTRHELQAEHGHELCIKIREALHLHTMNFAAIAKS